MSEISFFKPNRGNTGFHFKFNIGANNKRSSFKELVLYIQATKQYSWDDNKKQGSFKKNFGDPENSVNIKMNLTECAEIVSVIDRVKAFTPINKQYVQATIENDDCGFYRMKAYHSFDQNNTLINFVPTKLRDGEFFPTGMFFSISKNGGERYYIKLSLGELEELKALIKFGFDQNFTLHRKQLANIESKNEGEAYQQDEYIPQNEVPDSIPEDEDNPFI
jgi:hypothetical protein